MLIAFFFKLREYRLPVSLRELLDLINALKQGVIFADVDAFYYLARTIMVKDETQFDRFDKAFADYFSGVADLDLLESLKQQHALPDDWLRKEFEKHLSEEEKAQLQAMGGLDKLMETLKLRLEEQQKRHAGGINGSVLVALHHLAPMVITLKVCALVKTVTDIAVPLKYGISAATVTLIATVKLAHAIACLKNCVNLPVLVPAIPRFNRNHPRNCKARRHARCKNGTERHNAVKVLMLFDIGGSMDDYIHTCEEYLAPLIANLST